jgi:hypothetical protein
MDLMDLFTPLVSEETQHPNFRTISKYTNTFNQDVLNEWAGGFKDRDGKFVKEFQTTFDSSFWELYLFAVMKHFHLEVDFSFSAPDFVITNHGGINIEATVASHAQGSPPESVQSGAPIPDDLNEFNKQTIIRISNSFDAKRRKYIESYAGLPHVQDRPFVLAVSAFDRPFAMLTCQRAIEAVFFGYYVDEERFLREGGALKGKRIESVTKDNKSPVPVGIFASEDFAWLSAVIFSSTATWGKVRALSSDPNPNIVFQAVKRNLSDVKPLVTKARKADYHESLLDGLRVYHNPEATHKLNKDVFRDNDVFQSYYSEEKQDWVYEDRTGLLLFRRVHTAMKTAKTGPAGKKSDGVTKEES